jgi:hypothetical protein
MKEFCRFTTDVVASTEEMDGDPSSRFIVSASKFDDRACRLACTANNFGKELINFMVVKVL